ncbi:MAG: cyclic nucleotide-binding domain-containing protein [Gammaproteobacteria bacterium]
MKPKQHAGKKFNGQEILRDLIPLNALSIDRYREVTTSLTIKDISAGSYLFGEGDRDNHSIYLLDGVVNFIDAHGKVTGVVSAGTDPARYPLANQQPRITTARAATKSVIATIDSTLLDVMLTLDQTAETGTVDIYANSEEDWMTRMLQSEAFSRMPPADIQRLIQSLQPVNVYAGDTVVCQGDEGDYFYIIREGKCSVTRLASGKGWDVPLAELGPGDCFGEDALVSDARRNATITMLTDGSLMRLSKHQFVEILKKPLVHYLNYELADAAVQSGAVWVDVRTADEHMKDALEGSINMPLFMIRETMKKLDATKTYILYCDTGRRSAAAAFLLGQRGFDISVLEGGLNQGAPQGTVSTAGTTGELTLTSMETDTTPAPSATVINAPAITAGSNSADNLRQELKQARASEQTARAQFEQLQDEVATLRSDLERYIDKVLQVEIAHEAERIARENLTARLERLLSSIETK